MHRSIDSMGWYGRKSLITNRLVQGSKRLFWTRYLARSNSVARLIYIFLTSHFLPLNIDPFQFCPFNTAIPLAAFIQRSLINTMISGNFFNHLTIIKLFENIGNLCGTELTLFNNKLILKVNNLAAFKTYCFLGKLTQSSIKLFFYFQTLIHY